MAGCFDVSYEYDDELDKTLCRLASTGGGVAIGASRRRPGIFLQLTRGGQTVGMDLSRSDVQQISSEMHRALAGCFEGEWPRPVEAARTYSTSDVADPELERLLAEEQEIEAAARRTSYRPEQVTIELAHKAQISEAAERAEREAELREEDEMNRRDHLEDAARAAGKPAMWTVHDFIDYLFSKPPLAHVEIKPLGNGLCEVTVV